MAFSVIYFFLGYRRSDISRSNKYPNKIIGFKILTRLRVYTLLRTKYK